MVAVDCAEDLDAPWQLRTDGHRKGQGLYNASELYQMVNKMSIFIWMCSNSIVQCETKLACKV